MRMFELYDAIKQRAWVWQGAVIAVMERALRRLPVEVETE